MNSGIRQNIQVYQEKNYWPEKEDIKRITNWDQIWGSVGEPPAKKSAEYGKYPIKRGLVVYDGNSYHCVVIDTTDKMYQIISLWS